MTEGNLCGTSKTVKVSRLVFHKGRFQVYLNPEWAWRPVVERRAWGLGIRLLRFSLHLSGILTVRWYPRGYPDSFDAMIKTYTKVTGSSKTARQIAVDISRLAGYRDVV